MDIIESMILVKLCAIMLFNMFVVFEIYEVNDLPLGPDILYLNFGIIRLELS